MPVRSRLFRNAGTAIMQTGISAVVLFILYRFLLVELGIEKLGLWSVLFAFVSAARVSELGLAGGVTRFVARYSGRNDPVSAACVIETAVISVGLIMALLLFASYPVLEGLLDLAVPREGLIEAEALLPYAVIAVWIASLGGVALGALDGCQRADTRSILLIVGHAVFLTLAVAMVPPYGLHGLVYAQIGQNLLLLVAGWFLLRRELPDLARVPRRWNRPLFREMLGYGSQFQFASIAMMLHDPMTKALLSRFGGLAMAGYFEMASQMVTKLRSLLIAGNQVVVPTIAATIECDPALAHRMYRNAYGLMLYLTLPFYAALIAAVPLVSIIWLDAYQGPFVLFATFVALSWFVNSVTAPSYFANLGIGHLRWNTLSHIVIGFLNVFLGILLGVAFGAVGVVAGWAIALAGGSTVVVLAYHREHREGAGAILPQEYRVFALVCAGGAAWGLLAHIMFAQTLPLVLLAGITALGFAVVVCPVVWLHPMRQRLSRWIQRGGGHIGQRMDSEN
jgi:O-antigen/teichoic acid export membrane protein